MRWSRRGHLWDPLNGFDGCFGDSDGRFFGIHPWKAGLDLLMFECLITWWLRVKIRGPFGDGLSESRDLEGSMHQPKTLSRARNHEKAPLLEGHLCASLFDFPPSNVERDVTSYNARLWVYEVC